MAQLKDLLVTGPSRFIGDTFANNFETFRVTNHLIPITTNTYDLGTEDLRWNHIYANSIFGEADSAKRLSDGHNFNVSDFDKTNVGGVVSFNGTQNVELLLPENIKFKNILATQNITVNTGNIDIVNVAETDKYLGFYYNANKTAGASWRIGHIGSGSGETNYFVIQSGTSTTSATTWNDVIRLEMNSFNALFKGNIIPQVTNTKTLGTSNLKWKELYSGKAYIGDSATYGSGIKPIYWNDGVPTPSTSSIGSATKPIYLDGGTITVGTYELKSTVNAGTTPQLAWYSGNNTISSTAGINYLNAVSVTSGSAAGTQTGLRIFGTTYGDTASNLKSNTTGVFRYGDPGVQIQFSTGSTTAQDGALIYTDHDNAGSGVSWHFVTNQSDDNDGGSAIVTAPRFRARKGLTIGQNTDNTTYKLYVNGTTYHTSNVYFGNGTTYQVTDTGDAKFRYLATGPDASINTNYPLNVKGNSYLNGTAEVTGAFTGDSTGLFKNILTLYRESTTAQNYPAGIQFKNKDTTTGKEDSQGYIYAYNSHATGDSQGLNMRIQANSSLFIGAGEGVSNVHTALFGTAAHTDEILFLVADGKINIEANANGDTSNGSTANRIGFQVDTAGHIIPVKAEANNTNVQNLGSSNSRWAKLYIGTKDTYGSTTKPIWWDQGVPKEIAYSISASIAEGATNALIKYTGANAIGIATNVGDATHPIYIASTGIPTQTTVTNNTSATAYVNNTDALVTMKTLYYGSASINNARQTSSVSVYAPTSGGDAGKFLIAQGATSTPTWQSPKVEGVALKGNGNIIYIGVCSTPAGTAAKTVTLTGEQTFELVNGARVFVKFDNVNTAANPTLSVNNTTAKNITIYGTTAPNSICTWQSGEVVEFVYDGTQWERVGGSTNPKWRILYAVCSTAAGTAAKAVTFDNFTLETGAHIYVKFTYNNTAANPTLNVNNTGAKSLWINGAVAGDSEIESWKAGAVLDFVYDGTNWVAVSENKGYTPASGGTADQFLVSSGENTAPTWKNPKVEGVTLKSDEQTLHYGVCTTATGTVAKTATLNGNQTFTLVNGSRVIIKFDHTNTAANPTLNVNGTGAKPIYRYGNTYAGVKVATSWKDNSVVEFVYDGNAWMIAASGGGSIDITNNNTKKSYLVGYDDDLYYYDSNVYLDTTSGMMYSKYNKTDYLRVYSDDTGTSKNAIINGNVDIGTGETMFTGSGTQTILTNSNEATPFTAVNDTYTFTYDTTNSIWVNNNPTNTSTYAKKTWTAKNNYILTFTFSHNVHSYDQFTVYLNGTSKYNYATTSTTGTGTLTLKVKTGDIILVQFYHGTNTSTSYTHTCKFTVKYESATITDTFTYLKDVTSFTNDTNATSYTTGAVKISGGVGIAKDVYTNGKLNVKDDANLTNGTLITQNIVTGNGTNIILNNSNLSTYFTVENDITYPWIVPDATYSSINWTGSGSQVNITNSNASTYFTVTNPSNNGTAWTWNSTENAYQAGRTDNVTTYYYIDFKAKQNCLISFQYKKHAISNDQFYIYYIPNGGSQISLAQNTSYATQTTYSAIGSTYRLNTNDTIRLYFRRYSTADTSYDRMVYVKPIYQAITGSTTLTNGAYWMNGNFDDSAINKTSSLKLTAKQHCMLSLDGTGSNTSGDTFTVLKNGTSIGTSTTLNDIQVFNGDIIELRYQRGSYVYNQYPSYTHQAHIVLKYQTGTTAKEIVLSGRTRITNNTVATSTTTGALQVTGGIGVQGAGYFGSLNATNITGQWLKGDYLRIKSDDTSTSKQAIITGNIDLGTGATIFTPNGTETALTSSNETTPFTVTNDTYTFNFDSTDNAWINNNTSTSTTARKTLVAKSNYILKFNYNYNSYYGYFRIKLNGVEKLSYRGVTNNYNGTLTLNVKTGDTIIIEYQRETSTNTSYTFQVKIDITYQAATTSDSYTVLKDDVSITKDTQSTSTTTGVLKVSGGVGIAKNVNIGGNTNIVGELTNTGDTSFTSGTLLTQNFIYPTNTTVTTLDNSNLSTYFTVENDTTYPWIAPGASYNLNTWTSSGSSVAITSSNAATYFTIASPNTAWTYNSTEGAYYAGGSSITTATTYRTNFTAKANCQVTIQYKKHAYSGQNFYVYYTRNGTTTDNTLIQVTGSTSQTAYQTAQTFNLETGDRIGIYFNRSTNTNSSYTHDCYVKITYQAMTVSSTSQTNGQYWMNGNYNKGNSFISTTSSLKLTAKQNCLLSLSDSSSNMTSDSISITRNGTQIGNNTTLSNIQLATNDVLIIKYSRSNYTYTQYPSYVHQAHIILKYSAGTPGKEVVMTGRQTRFTGNIAATSKTTGTVQITGGLGVSGDIYASSFISDWLKGTYLRINSTDTSTSKNAIIAGNVDIGTGNTVFTANGNETVLTSSNETTPFTLSNGTYTFVYDSNTETWKNNNASNTGTTATKEWTAKSNYILKINCTYNTYSAQFYIYQNGVQKLGYTSSSTNGTGSITLNVKTGDVIKLSYARGNQTSTTYTYTISLSITYQAATTSDTYTVLKDEVSITKGTESTSTTTGTLKVTGGVGITKNVYIGGNLNTTGTIVNSGNTSFTGGVFLTQNIVVGNGSEQILNNSNLGTYFTVVNDTIHPWIVPGATYTETTWTPSGSEINITNSNAATYFTVTNPQTASTSSAVAWTWNSTENAYQAGRTDDVTTYYCIDFKAKQNCLISFQYKKHAISNDQFYIYYIPNGSSLSSNGTVLAQNTSYATQTTYSAIGSTYRLNTNDTIRLYFRRYSTADTSYDRMVYVKPIYQAAVVGTTSVTNGAYWMNGNSDDSTVNTTSSLKLTAKQNCMLSLDGTGSNTSGDTFTVLKNNTSIGTSTTLNNIQVFNGDVIELRYQRNSQTYNTAPSYTHEAHIVLKYKSGTVSKEAVINNNLRMPILAAANGIVFTDDSKNLVSRVVRVNGMPLTKGIVTGFGTCSTAAGTAAKIVNLQNSEEFTLETGARVFIKFTNNNTIANPTLNVNNTGAKTIYRYGNTTPGTVSELSWQPNAVVEFIYDGSAWQMVNGNGGGITPGTSGYILTGAGTSAAPTWTNILPIAHGGTGLSSFTTNRIYYPSASTTLTASSHYIANDRIAINSTSSPSYNLYVNGTFNATTLILPTASSTTVGAIWIA